MVKLLCPINVAALYYKRYPCQVLACLSLVVSLVYYQRSEILAYYMAENQQEGGMEGVDHGRRKFMTGAPAAIAAGIAATVLGSEGAEARPSETIQQIGDVMQSLRKNCKPFAEMLRDLGNNGAVDKIVSATLADPDWWDSYPQLRDVRKMWIVMIKTSPTEVLVAITAKKENGDVCIGVDTAHNHKETPGRALK